MSPKLEEQRSGEPKRAAPKEPEGGPLEAAVRGSVLSELGSPPGLHRVQVRRVWGDSYRVNVFVGDDAASFKVAHSFFLQADGDGRVIESSPAIARLYSPQGAPEPPRCE
jgi:hypothetical protein